MIEMATGKPPLNQQILLEVATLFHVGTTKSHPPIPEHLSMVAKDFLLKYLQKEPNLRPADSDLLQELGNPMATPAINLRNSMNSLVRHSTCTGLKDVCEMGSARCSTVYPENSSAGSYWRVDNFDDDTCQIDEKYDFGFRAAVKFNSALASADLDKRFNPMCEPTGDGPCKFDESPELERNIMNVSSSQAIGEAAVSTIVSGKGENEFTFPCGSSAAEDDDEVTESEIDAFLDGKALDLKKVETPLYEEFYSTLNATGHPSGVCITNVANFMNLPPKSRSPKRLPRRRLSAAVLGAANTASPRHQKGRLSNVNSIQDRALQEIQPPQLNDCMSFPERQRKWKQELDEQIKRKWKEELDEEMEKNREMM